MSDPGETEGRRDWRDAPCGLAVLNDRGVIVRVNAAFCSWFGHTADALVGKRAFSDLLSVGGRIFYQTHVLPLLRIQGSVAELKLDIRSSEGALLPVLANLHVEDGGGVAVAVFIAKDRATYERELLDTRRRAEEALARQMEAQRALSLAEASLQLALERARVGILRIGRDGARQFSRSTALLLGHAEPGPVDEAQFLAALHPEDRGRERALAVLRPAPGDGPVRQVYRLNGVDGSERVVEACGQGIFSTSGVFREMVVVVYDVTDLTRRRAEAEDRAVLAEQMIGIVSHDLRNPLMAVAVGLDIFTNLPLTPRQTKVREHMVGAVERSFRLIGDLLDFTSVRLGAGLQVDRRPVDVHAVLEQAIAELQLSFPGAPLRSTFHGEPVFVLDPDRLVQALGNLVGNAVRYGAAGPAITVDLRIADDLRLSVHNEGAPIPEERQPGLFDAMVRGGTHRHVQGVGLGLFIVRAIARAHGGDVTVVSGTGIGTTFTVRFASQGEGASSTKPTQ